MTRGISRPTSRPSECDSRAATAPAVAGPVRRLAGVRPWRMDRDRLLGLAAVVASTAALGAGIAQHIAT